MGLPQEADLVAVAAMVTKHVEAIIPPDLTGNCVRAAAAAAPHCLSDPGGRAGGRAGGGGPLTGGLP